MVAPDVFAADSLEDPYDLYARLRAEEPVHRLERAGVWLVSRHAEVMEVVSDPATYSSQLVALLTRAPGEDAAASLVVDDLLVDGSGAVDVLATADPPAHTLQRRVVSRTFAAGAVAGLEPSIRETVASLLEGAGPRVEWMEAVAVPLPVVVVASLLGFPEADVPRFRRWSDHGVELLSGVAPPERMAELARSTGEFLAALGERLAAARRAPGDDVLGDVARAVDDDTLDERQATSLLLQLVIAGTESTTSLLGSAVRVLAERPDLQAGLRADPSGLPAFVEEVLRLESPFRGHFRVTTRDVELGGVRLPRGSRLMLLWGSANRDAEAFDRPDRLDPGRDRGRGHLAFGWGVHFCVGAPLARLEARVALETLLERAAGLRLDGDAPPPRHVPSLFVRRLASLALVLDPAA